MSILVTGATGTVGTQVVKALAMAGAKCRAAVHSREKGARWHGSSVAVVDFDFENPATFSPALSGIQKIFMLQVARPNQAAIAGPFIKAARDAGVKHIVKLSVFFAGDENPTLFASWHRPVEKLLESSGLAWTHLRANSYMQIYIKYYGDRIRRQSTFATPQGNGKVSLVDARDIAAMAAMTLTKSGHEQKTYHLTGPAAVSNHEIAEILSRVTSRPIRYESSTDEEARGIMQKMAFPPWLVDAMTELNRANRAGRAAPVFDDIPKVLGRPAATFERFALDHVSAFNA